MATKGEKTRESILNASYVLFANKGFKQVTMKDVCQITNMSRGGLYSHFASTSHIFEAILEKILVDSSHDINSLIDKGVSAKTILEDAFKIMEDEYKHPENSLSLAMYEYAQTVDSKLIENLNKLGQEKWKRLIEYGIERDEFNKVDVDEIVNLILYSYQGIRLWSGIINMKSKTYKSIGDNIKRQLIKGGR